MFCLRGWWERLQLELRTRFIKIFLSSNFKLLLLAYGSLTAGKLSLCWSATMPLMLCPYTNTLVLILPTSEGWQAESTPPGVNSAANGTQTQDPNIPNQPPSPGSQHQAFISSWSEANLLQELIPFSYFDRSDLIFCCNVPRCHMAYLLIRFEWFDPIFNTGSYPLHGFLIISHILSSCIFVCTFMFSRLQTWQLFTSTGIFSTICTQYHPLKNYTGIQAHTDDATTCFGIFVDGDFDYLILWNMSNQSEYKLVLGRFVIISQQWYHPRCLSC